MFHRYCVFCKGHYVELLLREPAAQRLEECAFIAGLSLTQLFDLMTGGGDVSWWGDVSRAVWPDRWEQPSADEVAMRAATELNPGDRVLCLTTGTGGGLIRAGREYVVRSVHPDSGIVHLELDETGAPSVGYPIKWFERLT